MSLLHYISKLALGMELTSSTLEIGFSCSRHGGLPILFQRPGRGGVGGGDTGGNGLGWYGCVVNLLG